MHVFLTGGTGFIGQSLTALLCKRGWAVTALVRDPQSAAAQALQQMGATPVKGDILDRESMRAAMIGADIVIHNAAWYELGIGGREAEARMQAVNVDGARNTLMLAHDLGIARIVHVSSIVVAGATGDALQDESFTRQEPFPNPYERTKAEAHAIALNLIKQGAPITMALPGAVIGPGDHANLGVLQRMYVRGFAPPLTIGSDYVRCQVYVDDCAEGIALIAEKGRIGESYLLAAGSLSYRAIYDLWSTTPGGMKQIAAMPKSLAVVSAAIAEPVQRLFGLPNLLSMEAARAAYSYYDYSGEKARRELGWQPRDLRHAWLETLAEERRRAGRAF
jgi:dihydroflavonol-4-reductase